MQNRIPRYPGRIKLTEVDAANGIYDLTRADDPEVVGTPLAKKLLDFAVAACGVTAGTSTAYTLDGELVDGFTLSDGAKVNFKLHVASGANATLNVGGTGAKAIRNVMGEAMLADIPAGTWMSARYSETFDAYVVEEALSDALLGEINKGKWELISINVPGNTVQEAVVSLPSGYRAYKVTIQGSNIVSATIATNANTSYSIVEMSNSGAISITTTSSTTIKSELPAGKFYCEAVVGANQKAIHVKYQSGASSGVVAFEAVGTSGYAIASFKISGSIASPSYVILEGLK